MCAIFIANADLFCRAPPPGTTPRWRGDSGLRYIFPASRLLVGGRMDPKSGRRPMSENKSTVDRGHGEKNKSRTRVVARPMFANFTRRECTSICNFGPRSRKIIARHRAGMFIAQAAKDRTDFAGRNSFHKFTINFFLDRGYVSEFFSNPYQVNF